MEYGAIDLHKKESQIRIVMASGEIVDQRIATTRERLTHVFWGRPPMRILIEASTESEWVALHLEQLGHEVIMADPNYGPMYGHRSRRIKTDRRDVAALTEACYHGTYRLAHRKSARQHEVQCRLNVRQELTQARTRAISLARAITRAAGLRIRSGRTETFLDRLAALELPAAMKTTLSPLRSIIEVLDDELVNADEWFETMAGADPVVTRLTTLPGIGPITATAFVAALDSVSRFERAGQVTSYLGLVPQEHSSGENNTAVGSCAAPNRICSRSSCKRHGVYRVHRTRQQQLFGRGRRPLHAGAARKSRWSHSLDVSRARCSRCGATRPTINRDAFEPGARNPWRTRPPRPAPAPRCKSVRSSSWRSKRALMSGRNVRAVLKRALLLLRILPCAGTAVPDKSAYKRVSHLAVRQRGSGLDGASDFRTRSRVHPLAG